MAVIAFSDNRTTRWLRCVSCSSGHVDNSGVISPSTKPLSVPAGIPPVELAAWKEVRECLGIGAYTSAVMMCRKLLFHIAVSHALPEKNEQGRAPTYSEAVQHLEKTELITKKMLPWVERIKEYGNDANHEIIPMTIIEAKDAAIFTEQLLKLAYEMDELMARKGSEDTSPGIDEKLK